MTLLRTCWSFIRHVLRRHVLRRHVLRRHLLLLGLLLGFLVPVLLFISLCVRYTCCSSRGPGNVTAMAPIKTS